MKRVRRALEIVGLVTACIVCEAACNQQSRPPAAQQKAAESPVVLSAYTPQGALTEFAPGLLYRKAYVAVTPGGLNLETWDITVGPGKTTGATKLPGAAVLEVRSGRGAATVGGKPTDIRPGSMVSVDEGQELILRNSDSNVPMSIRAAVISGAQK